MNVQLTIKNDLIFLRSIPKYPKYESCFEIRIPYHIYHLIYIIVFESLALVLIFNKVIFLSSRTIYIYICICLYMHMHIYVKRELKLSDSWLFWNMHYWTFNLWWKWQSSLTRRLTRNVIIASKKQNFNLLLNLRFKINWEDANEIVYRLIRSFKFYFPSHRILFPSSVYVGRKFWCVVIMNIIET